MAGVGTPAPLDLAVARARVATLTKAGWTAPRIAEELGCTTRTVQRHRAATGTAQQRAPLHTDEFWARVKGYLDDGASCEEVGRTLGVDGKVIRHHFPEYTWNPQQVGSYALTVVRFNEALRRAS